MLSKFSPTQSRKTAFTLIEILMVVGIIAVLIGILIPVLARARESSRRVVCQANLREHAIAWQNYTSANDGAFFQEDFGYSNYAGDQGKGEALYGSDEDLPVSKPVNPYLGLDLVSKARARVARCPSDSGEIISGKQTNVPCADYYGNSYITNLILTWKGPVPVETDDPCFDQMATLNARLPGVKWSQLVDASTILLVGDFGWSATWSYWYPNRAEWHAKPYSHNIAFADGHATFTRIRKRVHVAAEYTVIPFQDLRSDFLYCQVEIPTE